MAKLYGSLINRLAENREDGEEIKIGDYATQYYYTDREAFKVVGVTDQKHITLQKVNDNKEVISNSFDIVKRGDYWYTDDTYNTESFEKAAKVFEDSFKGDERKEAALNYVRYMSGLTQGQLKRVDEGKTIHKYGKINISFHIFDPFFDLSF